MGIKQKIEDNVGLTLAAASVAGFLAGFGAYKAILSAGHQDVVTNGTYLLNETCDEKVKKQCSDRAALGYSSEKLAAHLLDLLQPKSEALIRENAQSHVCVSPTLVSPETKVELVAYLNSGEQALRRKAILAYSECSIGINDAFYLARTIKPDESISNFDAYSFGLCIINSHHGSAPTRMHLKEYLLEVGAPQGLVNAFLAEPNCE